MRLWRPTVPSQVRRGGPWAVRRVVAAWCAVAVVAACTSDDTVEPDEAAAETLDELDDAEPAAEPEPEPEPEPEAEPVELDADEQDLAGGAPELVWSDTHDEILYGVAVAPDGVTLAVAGRASYLHHVADGRLVDAVVYDHFPENVTYSPDGAWLGVGLGMRGSALVDADARGEPVPVGDGFNGTLAFSPDSSQLATSNRDGVIQLWDGDGSAEQGTLDDGANEWIVALEYDPSGRWLASLDFTCLATVWDLDSGEVTRTLELDTLSGSCGSATQAMRFSPDGELIAGAVAEDFDGSVRFWTIDGDVLGEVETGAALRDLAFSPDSGLVAIALLDSTVVVDVATRSVLYTLDQEFEPGASAWPTAVMFTPDGGHLAVSRFDGTVELWRLPGAEPLVAPEPEPCEPFPLPGDVLFDTAAAELRADASPVLEQLATELAETHPEASLLLVGHTDSRGDAGANQQLSEDRAASVTAWFEDWAAGSGIVSWSFETSGRGASELYTEDVDVQGQFLESAGELNRRVEIDITAPGCA
jgi:outer membrane protein OmpA-like peptidoglycan-associated protein